MKKKILSLILAGIILIGGLSGCSGGASSGPAASSAASESQASAGEQEKALDGRDKTVYREMYSAEFTTLDYYATSNNNEFKVLANGVDNLVEYDEYGIEKPGLAESWSHNEDYTVWTFNLRQGVMWYDFEGNEMAEVTAEDWVAAAEYVNTADNNCALQYMYDFVAGANEYYEQTAAKLEAAEAVADGSFDSEEAYYEENGIDTSAWITIEDVGVKAVDTYTLEYTLNDPCTFFVSVTSFASYLPIYGSFVKQMGVNFGADNTCLLYNGAYILTEYEPQVRRVLTANENYWDRENVYITRLEYIYNANNALLAPSLFQSGELDYALIPSDIIDEWMANEETANLICPTSVDLDYSYFYTFNFEPRFNEAYEPDNWLLAVNNESFRLSLQHGLDRLRALSVYDPYNPDTSLSNTITPTAFVSYNGKDYTEYGGLDVYANGDTFNEELAISYRDAAIEELTAAGASFPIKILTQYNPDITNWDKECQIVEQQLEALLGTDYIDIIVETGPATAFLSEVRRSGNYAFLLCNWGADFADPSTYAEPFRAVRNNYNFMATDPETELGGVTLNNKSAETEALTSEYYGLIEKAKAAVEDGERYEYYAQAEALLIKHAFVIPMHVSYEGYAADMRSSFDRQYATFGLPRWRMKGRQLMDKPFNAEEYAAALSQWEEERAAAIAAAAAN